MKKYSILVIIIAITISSCLNKDKKRKFDPEAMNLEMKASNLMMVGKLDSALILLDKAIQIDSTYFMAYGLKANIYFQEKDTAKGLIEMEKQLKAKPDFAEGWVEAAIIYDCMGDSLKALNYYKKAITLYDERLSKPDKASTVRSNRLNKACCLILSGQFNNGNIELHKLKTEDPNSVDSMTLNRLINKSRQDLLHEYGK